MHQRLSSRTHDLHNYLVQRLQGASHYDRIAGYFCTSLLHIAGEAYHQVGAIRMVCNGRLRGDDARSLYAAQVALRQQWYEYVPEILASTQKQEFLARLAQLLVSQQLQVRIVPDVTFGMVHGKAGVIRYPHQPACAFVGSVNETAAGWRSNYELLWEDSSPAGVAWVAQEFDALWQASQEYPLPDDIITDIDRLARRRVISVRDWRNNPQRDPASIIVESPIQRIDEGLWEHQKFFIKKVYDDHVGPYQRARYVLADQVGLGKTLQLGMAAKLIAVLDDAPILIICPRTLTRQWQGELSEKMAVPSAIWEGGRWVCDDGSIVSAAINACPRRVGIVSQGIITNKQTAAKVVQQLLAPHYACVIVDEAHRARRSDVADTHHTTNAPVNKLLAFVRELATRTKTMLLATATPVQLDPIEAWDLLRALNYGAPHVLGSDHSRWNCDARTGLEMVMQRIALPSDIGTRWEWLRDPLPVATLNLDAQQLRNDLMVSDADCTVGGSAINQMSPNERQRIHDLFVDYMINHNPIIQAIVRRSRDQLERETNPRTQRPYLRRITVHLHGEHADEAIALPIYLQKAYEYAEVYTHHLARRVQGAGFIKTLLLRRMGSSMYAGMQTVKRLLARDALNDYVQDDDGDSDDVLVHMQRSFASMTDAERDALQACLAMLERNHEQDPKAAQVVELLRQRRWLDDGVIIFSQFYESVDWLAQQLTVAFPAERIAIYAGGGRSGIWYGSAWQNLGRDDVKRMVQRGEIRIMIGTDAASEGLNLQRMGKLINLDLPWNPTRLEQRKGRIQRIGQTRDTVHIYNMRYRDSVEDRVHALLSDRLKHIYDLFGQVPDVLSDVWIDVAIGDQAAAVARVSRVPHLHPFVRKYTTVVPVAWEGCAVVVDAHDMAQLLHQPWPLPPPTL